MLATGTHLYLSIHLRHSANNSLSYTVLYCTVLYCTVLYMYVCMSMYIVTAIVNHGDFDTMVRVRA